MAEKFPGVGIVSGPVGQGQRHNPVVFAAGAEIAGSGGLGVVADEQIDAFIGLDRGPGAADGMIPERHR